MSKDSAGIFETALGKAYRSVKSVPLKWKLGMAIGVYAGYINARNMGWLPKKEIKGDHVFMTGAGSGIGRIMALKLASLGCQVTCADIDLAAAEETVSLIEKERGLAIAVECDVTSSEQLAKAATEAKKCFGTVTILINNAGIVHGKKFMDVSEKELQLTYNVNVISHSLTVKEFLPGMLAADRGHIVTISSMGGVIGAPGLGDYCGSKFAAFGFDESLRLELKKLGSHIKTTCVCPFFIDTGMFNGVRTNFPLLPLLEPNWVAERIITAMRQNENVVMLPWFASLAFSVRGMLPTWAFDHVMNFVGATSTMDDLQKKPKRLAKL